MSTATDLATQVLSLFPATKGTGRHYQDFDTVDQAADFAKRMRETHQGVLTIFQSGRRVYLDRADGTDGGAWCVACSCSPSRT